MPFLCISSGPGCTFGGRQHGYWTTLQSSDDSYFSCVVNVVLYQHVSLEFWYPNFVDSPFNLVLFFKSKFLFFKTKRLLLRGLSLIIMTNFIHCNSVLQQLRSDRPVQVEKEQTRKQETQSDPKQSSILSFFKKVWELQKNHNVQKRRPFYRIIHQCYFPHDVRILHYAVLVLLVEGFTVIWVQDWLKYLDV